MRKYYHLQVIRKVKHSFSFYYPMNTASVFYVFYIQFKILVVKIYMNGTLIEIFICFY